MKAENLVKTISGNSLLRIETQTFSNGLSRSELKDLEEELNIKLPEEALNIYGQMNGFRLYWKLADQTLAASREHLEGAIKILNLMDMILGFEGMRWKNELWRDDMPKAEKTFNQSLKVFDYYSTDSVECVCLQLSDKRELIPNLWLYFQDLGPLELTISLGDYFETVSKTKAIWGWQYFFLKKSFKGSKFHRIRQNCEMVIEEYGKYFSDEFEKELKNLYMRLINK